MTIFFFFLVLTLINLRSDTFSSNSVVHEPCINFQGSQNKHLIRSWLWSVYDCIFQDIKNRQEKILL